MVSQFVPESGLALADELLALPTPAARAARLRAAHWLSPAGIDTLLDLAAQLIRSDPGKGRQLAECCGALAAQAGAPAAVPRAIYIGAQAHALNAEFDTALELMESARRAYTALGETLGALRTYTGLMSVLIDLGRYPAALEAGRTALAGLRQATGDDPPAAAQLIAAIVHQNLGICYDQIGRYDAALHAYNEAEARYRALGMAENLGHIANNRGVVLLGLGRGGEALAAFEAAAAIFASAGLMLSHGQALVNVGDAQLLLGSYTRALDAFERARRLLEPLDAQADKHVLVLDTADAYLALNLFPEALAAYRQAERLFEAAAMPHERARALWGMGAALVAQAHYDAAALALAPAAQLFAAADNAPLLSSVLLEQAGLQAARGDTQAALATAQRSLTLVGDHDWPVQRIYTHMRMADLLLPDVAAAEPHMDAALRLASHLSLPHLHYRLNQRLGRVRMLQGRHAEARALLTSAIDQIEQLRGTLAHEAMRTSFLHDKATVYEDLVALLLEPGDTAGIRAAFGIAERAKSRALVDMLAGVVETRLALADDDALAARLATLQADLNAIYNELLGTTSEPASSQRRASLHTSASELELEISRLRLQAAAAMSAHDLLAAPLQLDQIEARLPADLLLLAYHCIGDEIIAFVCAGGRVLVARALGSVGTTQRLIQRLGTQWDRFRAGHAFIEQHIRQLELSAQRVLQALYAELFAPLEPLIAELLPQPAGGTPLQLAIVRYGPLHQVPMHALFDGQQYLIDRFEISYAPSATVLALCQGRAPRQSGAALIMGVADASIPEVIGEVHAVARQLPGAVVRIDEHATLAALREAAPGCAVLHLACHGLFRVDNPMFSALKLCDGWLTAADAIGLDLTGVLVTLSACETGRGTSVGGDEIVGLTRAFLGAGATTLVVSLWLAQDATTAQLMATWYELLRGPAGPAAALRAAQLRLRAAYPHPYYWAPFMVVGKR